MLFDSHVDTPTELVRHSINLGIDNPGAHVDFPKMKRAGVGGAFFALYTAAELPADTATRLALEMLSATYDSVEANADYAALAFSPEEAAENLKKGLISVFMGMENAAPIQESLSLLRTFYRLGVSYMTLTHNGDNAVADSAAEGKRWNGLSPFGREVVAEMNALGMMIDLSHASDKTFWDCIELSHAPIVATHSCCRALCSHRRNLTDEMLRAIGEKDGYVGINFYPAFLSDQWESKLPGVQEIVNHIDHAVELAGLEHVGIGTDYDGIEVTPEGMENISKTVLVWEEMKRRGYTEKEVELISGQNLLNVFQRVINCSELDS
ncbi:MAG: dipeptidase [Bacteroidales bacterium]|nr:dipeptidase [Bacteroidales bacterium]